MASLADPSDYSKITGNAPEHVKEAALIWYKLLQGHRFIGFGYYVRRKLRILEVSVEPSPDDPQAESTKMVCEVEIGPGNSLHAGMCDAQGMLDHGCMTFLMDEGSAISLLLLKIYKQHPESMIGVSQAFNIMFHGPPPRAGTTLRIVNRSISLNDGIGIGSCRTEIWDKDNHRLVVSGSQIQMQASKAKSQIP